MTNLLTQWLRGLPEPLLLYKNFQPLQDILDIPSDREKLIKIQELIFALPKENYHILRQIVRLMYIISLNSESNRMDELNISKVIGPNLLYSEDEDENPIETMNSMNCINTVLSIIVHYYPFLFEAYNPLNTFLFPSDSPHSPPSCSTSLAHLFKFDYLQNTDNVLSILSFPSSPFPRRLYVPLDLFSISSPPFYFLCFVGSKDVFKRNAHIHILPVSTIVSTSIFSSSASSFSHFPDFTLNFLFKH